MSFQTDGPLLEASYSITAQALCVGAVVLGSHYALKRWIAISALTPPELPHDQPPVTKAKKRLYKFVFAILFCLFIALEFGIFYGLTHIKSEVVLSAVFCGLEVLAGAAFVFGSSLVMFSPSRTVQIVRQKADTSRFSIKEDGQVRCMPRIAGSIALSGANAYLSSQGVRVLQPTLVACWVMATCATWCMPRMSTKWLTLGMNGYIFGVPLIAALAALAEEVTYSIMEWEHTPKTDETDDSPVPKAWVMRLTMSLVASLPSLMPSILIALALRFDHFRSSGALALKAAPGEAIPVPVTVPSFPRPLFKASLISLVIALAIGETLTIVFDAQHLSEAMWIGLTVPIVTLGTFGRAWSLGLLGDWWKYEERWVPKKEEAAKVATGEDVESEAAIAQEKKPLLSDSE